MVLTKMSARCREYRLPGLALLYLLLVVITVPAWAQHTADHMDTGTDAIQHTAHGTDAEANNPHQAHGADSGLDAPSLHVQSTNSSPVLDQDQSLAFSQSVIGTVPGDYRLTDQNGNPVSLYGYRGKPLVVNFIYTSCFHTCPVMTVHLKKMIEIARDAVGADSFSMVTIGFDAEVDTPDRMRLFAAQRGIDFSGWDFLSADVDTIQGITRDMGFLFVPSPNGFDHLAQTTILAADGVVYRQVYGATFETPVIVEPLKELVFGTHGSSGTVSQWLNGIKLFCTVYDPASNRYYFDYSIFYVIAIGLLCLASILVFVVRAWREHGKRQLAG